MVKTRTRGTEKDIAQPIQRAGTKSFERIYAQEKQRYGTPGFTHKSGKF
jgi:hypothetical protein